MVADSSIDENSAIIKRRYVCEHAGCGKSFKRSDHLTRHRQAHNNASPYHCTWPGCKKSFARKDVRTKHIKRHSIKDEKEKRSKLESLECTFEIYTPNSLDSNKVNSKEDRKLANHATEEIAPLSDDVKSEGFPSAESSPNMNNASRVSLIETTKQGAVSDDISTDCKSTLKSNVLSSDSDSSKVEPIKFKGSMTHEFKTPKKVIASNKEKSHSEDQYKCSSQFTNKISNLIDGPNKDQSFSNDDLQYTNGALGCLSDNLNECIGMGSDNIEPDKFEADLISWVLNTNSGAPTSAFIDHSPTSSFKDMFNDTPEFSISTSQSKVSEETRLRIIELIPALQYSKIFSIDRIDSFLDHYWHIFHVQNPIIHRPSFAALNAEPLLLMSMITMGAAIASRQPVNQKNAIEINAIAMQIAGPLRWLIFSAVESASTVTAWVVQALLILECYEITSTSRSFHRRANLHHGFKVELLRRSPFLGGDPSQSSDHDKSMTTGSTFWENWIEMESLKRCVYMAFYIETLHSIIFGHECIIFAHQIKLSMPCTDEFWEMSDFDMHKTISQNNVASPKFLVVLAKLIRNHSTEVDPFGRKILLAGLLSIIFQMEQNDIVNSLQWDNKKLLWRGSIFTAIDRWYDTCFESDCCSLDTAYYVPPELKNLGISDSGDTSCKFPMYHIVQSFLRLKQYDCIIYAGAPNRMNVKTEIEDLNAVEERVKKWANSYNGKISVVYAYLMIAEVLLSTTEDGRDRLLIYEPNSDPIFYRPNIVASLLFLIWDYCFCLWGPESDFYKEYESFNKFDVINSSSIPSDAVYAIADRHLPEKINGYAYIKYIKNNFDMVTMAKKKLSSAERIDLYVQVLDQIPNKHYTVGLLRLFKDSYDSCYSQICREYSRLMQNCIQRSLGREKTVCLNMYDESV